jgi:hypothetical protein
MQFVNAPVRLGRAMFGARQTMNGGDLAHRSASVSSNDLIFEMWRGVRRHEQAPTNIFPFLEPLGCRSHILSWYDITKDGTSQTSFQFLNHSTRLSNSEHFNFPASDILRTREKYCPIHSGVVLVRPTKAGSETAVAGVAMIAGITVITVGTALVKQSIAYLIFFDL